MDARASHRRLHGARRTSVEVRHHAGAGELLSPERGSVGVGSDQHGPCRRSARHSFLRTHGPVRKQAGLKKVHVTGPHAQMLIVDFESKVETMKARDMHDTNDALETAY